MHITAVKPTISTITTRGATAVAMVTGRVMAPLTPGVGGVPYAGRRVVVATAKPRPDGATGTNAPEPFGTRGRNLPSRPVRPGRGR